MIAPLCVHMCTQDTYLINIDKHFVVSMLLQDGAVILKTMSDNWGSNITLSQKKIEFVYKCVCV